MHPECHHTRTILSRYMQRELSDPEHNWVRRHLNECDSCHVEYCRIRDLEHDIRLSLPAFGTAGRLSVDRVWARLRSDELWRTRTSRLAGWRYSLAIVVVVVAFMFPLLLTDRSLTLASVPTQPMPGGPVSTPTSAVEGSLLAIVASPTPESNHQMLQPVAASILTP